jgi:hypothetical protein
MIHVEQATFRPPQRSFSEMDRDEIVRQTLSEVEKRIKDQHGNTLYRQAWKVILKIVHGMKP